MTETCLIQASDGYPLAATLHRPPAGRAHAVLVVSGATGVRRKFYDHFALHMADCGFMAITYDYRGIGDSRPNPHGLPQTMASWGDRDLVGVLDYARTIAPRLPLYVVGHSVGGQLIGLAPNNDLIAGAVTIGSQSGYWKHWPAGGRARMAFNWHVLIPALAGLLGELPGWSGTGQPLPKGVALQWARWCRDPQFLFGEAPARRRHFDAVATRMLVIGLDADPFAPPGAVDAFAGFYPNAAIERRSLRDPRLGHFDYFRPQFAPLWADVVNWFNALSQPQKEAA